MIKILFLLLFTQISFGWANCLVLPGEDDPIQKLSEDVNKVVEPTFSEEFKKGMEACNEDYSSSNFSATANRCGLDLEEFTLLRSYTGILYGCLNKAAREPEYYGDKIGNIQYLIEKLNKGLLKLPPYHGFVTRGASLPNEIRNLHDVGKNVTYKSFTSTSTHVGFDMLKDHFLIYTQSGRPIMGFSVLQGENEVLIPADTKFEIIHNFKDNGKNYFVMMEISANEKQEEIENKKINVLELYNKNYDGNKLKKISPKGDFWRCDQFDLLSPEKRKPIQQVNLPIF